MKPNIPWFTFQFHVYSDYTLIFYGKQRVTRIRNSNEEAINALVDVLEAAGFNPVQAVVYDYPAPTR